MICLEKTWFAIGMLSFLVPLTVFSIIRAIRSELDYRRKWGGKE